MVVWAVVIAGFGALALAAHVGPHLYRWLGAARLAALARSRGAIVLTYDDGPDAEQTPAILRQLADAGVRATFFMVGEHAEGRRALVQSVVDGGHELGTHAYVHQNAWKVGPWSSAQNVTRGFSAMETLTDQPIRLFRPPHGKLTVASWCPVWLRGARLAWWTDDSGDTSPDLRLERAREVARRIAARGGGVLLAHDFGGRPERQAFVTELTGAVVREARERGLEIITLGALLDQPS